LSEEHILAIKRAVSEAMAEQMKDFYLEREKHYQHHEFIEDLIQWRDSSKSTCLRDLANIIVAGAVGLMLLGFIAWGSKALKG